MTEGEIQDCQRIVDDFYTVLKATKAAHQPLTNPAAETKFLTNAKLAFARVDRAKSALTRELKAVRSKDFKRRSTWREQLERHKERLHDES